MHPSITLNRVMRAIERSQRDDSFTNISFPGFCHACGRKAKQPCEPDARNYRCQFKSCGKDEVFGAEETLMMIGG